MQCVLGLCDAQSFTGIGLLISGYSVLNSGISAYHWQIMVYLAWLANLTHMSGLTLLRTYFKSHRKERNWRLIFMAILFLLLLVAEIPTAFFNWASSDDREVSAANATSHARCFFNMQIATERFHVAARCSERCSVALGDCETRCTGYGSQLLSDTSAFQNMIVTFLLLAFNCFTRVMKIMDKPSTWVAYNLRNPLSRWWRRKILLADSAFLRLPRAWTPRKILIQKYFWVKHRLAMLLLWRLYADLYTSTLSEVSIRSSPTAVTTLYSLSHVTRYTGS